MGVARTERQRHRHAGIDRRKISIRVVAEAQPIATPLCLPAKTPRPNRSMRFSPLVPATSLRQRLIVTPAPAPPVRPILEALGSVRQMGPRSGAAMKLGGQPGLGCGDRDPRRSALSESPSSSNATSCSMPRMDSPIGPIVNAKRANVESGRFAPSFRLRHAAKDLRLVMEAAATRGRDLSGPSRPPHRAPAEATSCGGLVPAQRRSAMYARSKTLQRIPMPRMKGESWITPNTNVGARVPIHFAKPMVSD
jgi:hypothetical protein